MKSRYTKKVREEAALIASIVACSGTPAADCFLHEPAYDLYLAAWNEVTDRLGTVNWRWDDPEIDAEAEALIRTGWTPS